MKSKFYLNWKMVLAMALLFQVSTLFARDDSSSPSFANFDARARFGENLSVIFFGGPLTRGDGASDAERTSFRALLKNYLKEKYPASHFVFQDSTLGDFLIF